MASEEGFCCLRRFSGALLRKKKVLIKTTWGGLGCLPVITIRKFNKGNEKERGKRRQAESEGS